jgi:glycosyltransferase involved in cell wall biosynthesis
MDDSFLSKSLRQQLKEIGEVDCVVGIPSFNNARTIGQVVRAVQAGFAKYFSDQRTLIVNSDGGSTDGTQDVVQTASVPDYQTILAAHPIHGVHRIVTPYHGVPGKGSALRTVFGVAHALNAKACAVVDSDLRSITPEWLDLLLSPVYHQGFDFVAPLYHRHKYDGTITNSIVYPLTRALYGKRVRQPIGGDFGFSGRLAADYLKHDVWHSDVARFGIDIWMTTTAITGGYRVCQSFLGAKIHDVKDPGIDLSAMLTQVVSAVFSLMENHEPIWRTVRESESVPLFGFEHTVGLEPLHVDVGRMVGVFQSGVRDLSEIWERVLNPETFAQFQKLAGASSEDFRFPAALWVQVIYEFAVAYHKVAINREHLLRSLTPLYLGRTASFVNENEQVGAGEVDAAIEALCLEYEGMKPYLVERWNSS